MCDLGIIPSQSVVSRPTGGAVGLWRFADCALIGCTAAYKHNSISGEEDEDTRSAGMSTNKRFTKKPRRDRRRRPEHPLLCVFFPTTLSTGGFIDPLLQCSGLVRRLRKSPRSCRDPTLYTAHCCLLTRLRISIPRPSQHTRNVLPPCPRWWFTSTSKSGNRPRRRGSFHFQSWRISVRYEKKKAYARTYWIFQSAWEKSGLKLLYILFCRFVFVVWTSHGNLLLSPVRVLKCAGLLSKRLNDGLLKGKP